MFEESQLEIAQTNDQGFIEFMRKAFNFFVNFKELENSFYKYYARIKEKTVENIFRQGEKILRK